MSERNFILPATLVDDRPWNPYPQTIPPRGERVLCYSEGGGIVFGTWIGGLIWDDSHRYTWKSVKGWLPLPNDMPFA